MAGALRLSDDGKWYMPYEADFGAGSSSTTSFNGILGVGYKFGWGDVLVAWRYLDYKMDSNDCGREADHERTRHRRPLFLVTRQAPAEICAHSPVSHRSNDS